MGEPSIRESTPVRELHRHDLGGVDGAATAKAQDAINARLGCLLEGGIDLRLGCVLADDHGGGCLGLAQSATHPFDKPAFL